MHQTPRFQVWLPAVLCCLLLFAAMGKYTYSENPRTQKEHLYYFPNARALHVYVMGFDHAFADLLWMRTLAYFGGHYQTDRDYRYLANMLDIITRLNPRHVSAYYMSAVVLPWMAGALEESRSLLNRAMVNFPQDGRWAYYQGMNQYLFSGDRRLARHYLVRAIQRGYVNRFSIILAARLKAETDTLEGARAFLLQLLGNRQDKRMRGYLEAELRDVDTEIILRRVDRRLAALSGRTRTKLDLKLIRAKGMRLPKVLPDGGRIVIGADGLSRSSLSERRYRLHESERQKRLRPVR